MLSLVAFVLVTAVMVTFFLTCTLDAENFTLDSVGFTVSLAPEE